MKTECTVHLKRPLAEVALSAPVSDPAPVVTEECRQSESEHVAEIAQERAAIQQVIERLSEAAQQIETRTQQLLGEMQKVAVELAIAVASRLTHEKIEKGEFPVENMVADAIGQLGRKGPLKVRLNPQDIELLTRRLEGPPTDADGGPLALVADASLARGCCRVETDEVSVVSQIESQLAQLRRHLLGSLENAEIERRKPQPGDRNLRRFPDRRQTA